ncbi:MAG TPA: carboxypeptidase-like regulatory domain-containing protein [Myxococcota bacterium]|nr:carboxypeptidase-like regulatory domain-containing protein [Myxococcota bacterium]
MQRLSAFICLLLAVTAAAQDRPPVKLSGWVTGMKATDTAFVKIEGPVVSRTTTKPSGKWSVEVTQPGKYRVTLSADNYTFRPAERWVTLASGNRGAINFRAAGNVPATGAAEITGRVIGLAGGKNAEIQAVGPNELRAVTKAGGGFKLQGALPGRYTVMPRLPGFRFKPASRKITVKRGKSNKVRFKAIKIVKRTEHKPWMSGTVSGLEPGEIAIIRGFGQRRFTHKVTRNGRYEINEIRKGRYRIWISVPHCDACGYIPGPLKADIIQRGKTRIDFEIIHR